MSIVHLKKPWAYFDDPLSGILNGVDAFAAGGCKKMYETDLEECKNECDSAKKDVCKLRAELHFERCKEDLKLQGLPKYGPFYFIKPYVDSVL